MEYWLYVIVALVGAGIGAAVPFVLLEAPRRRGKQALATADRLRRTAEERCTELQQKQAATERSLRAEREELGSDREKFARELSAAKDQLRSERTELELERAALRYEQEQFSHRPTTLANLETENRILKQDLLNQRTLTRKLGIDEQLRQERQDLLDQRSSKLAERYLADVEKWVAGSLTANNYAACKQRLQKVIEWCREIGFDVTADREEALLSRLKTEYETEVRRALQREEQARIKAQIREQQAREREIQRVVETAERERAAIQAALDKAMAEAGAAHSAQVESLQARLAEAEARSQRAVAQAELTRAGHIYVISNIGTLGDGVVKIGMTRRLEPLDRIWELGDASVPFPFDVHMMISSEDAPALERALHQQFHRQRINRVNPRKEFFRVSLEEIRLFVESHHGEVQFTAEPEASEYRQSLVVSEGDQAYIEAVFEQAEKTIGIADKPVDD